MPGLQCSDDTTRLQGALRTLRIRVGLQRIVSESPVITDLTQKRPHPKSLSLRARDLPEELPFALREKGLFVFC